MVGFVSKLFGGGAIKTVGKIIDELQAQKNTLSHKHLPDE